MAGSVVSQPYSVHCTCGTSGVHGVIVNTFNRRINTLLMLISVISNGREPVLSYGTLKTETSKLEKKLKQKF